MTAITRKGELLSSSCESLVRVKYVSAMDVRIEPSQPPEVAALVEELVDEPRPEVDPWWRAGIAESLET